MFISLRGCRLHNLKNVNADFPIGKITVVCGPSGCGKSTLVLDTLHGESKRRYLETLSPYVVDMLGGKRNIPLDSAEGLPASLAIGPSHGESSAKAYALSIAECDNALRTLFALYAKPACPICGSPMESNSREEIIQSIANKEIGTKIQFFAAIDTAGNTLNKLAAVFLAQGFTRAFADNVNYSLADLTHDEKNIKPKEFYVVVDRIIIRENTRTRIAESVDTTLKLTHSIVILDIGGTREFYSTQPCCKNANDYNHSKTKLKEIISVLDAKSFSPYNHSCTCEFCHGTGLIETNDFSSKIECEHCNGLRLKDSYLNASIEGISYKKILSTTFNEINTLLHNLFDKKISQNLKPTFSTLINRIQAINELGLGYLTLGRAGHTLSGGEVQRLKLASLSTGHLNGLLIALDEPASGLHSNDVESLYRVLKKICDRGNTLVLIEHNPGIICHADYIIEMGPGAGEKGGEIFFQGNREDILKNNDSPTARWIKHLEERKINNNLIPILNNEKSKAVLTSIEVKNFAKFDMMPVNAKFPINKFSVITGQSGSGKSTLLFENIARRAQDGKFKDLGIEALSILTSGDFHGNRRSSVASAIGLMPLLRDLFAKLPESKVRGYNATKYSIHAPGGRCDNCKGEGVIYDPSGYEETECPICLGRRFRDEILEIRFKSFSIADILDMDIKKTYKLFANMKPFSEKLKPLVDTGLDYLRLGQTTAHLSGGERARLRLSIALSRAKAPNTLFLFDEPARGLHQKDIELLLNLIYDMREKGHTIIAIEHAQDFVDAADYAVVLSRN